MKFISTTKIFNFYNLYCFKNFIPIFYVEGLITSVFVRPKKLHKISIHKETKCDTLFLFTLIESVICLSTDSSVEKYFPLSNQLLFTKVISEIWLINNNLFLAIWISQISLRVLVTVRNHVLLKTETRFIWKQI